MDVKMNPKSIDYQQFSTLADLDLCHYVEPLIIDPTTNVSDDVLHQMLVDLPAYDEYHLAYALSIGARHCPKLFAPQLPKYLEHEKESVWCAALNGLNALSKEYLTQELLESVRRVRISGPKKQAVTELLDSLVRRSNELLR